MTARPFDRSVLLVEDNPVDIDLTLRAFAKRNLTNPILIVRNGEEALDWLPRWEAGEPLPLVILLDFKLPRIDGMEILRQLKKNPTSHKIPVVIVTSSAEDQDITETYHLGSNTYIVKPVDFTKFLNVASQIELYWCATSEPPR